MKPVRLCLLSAVLLTPTALAQTYVVGVEDLSFAPHYSLDAQGDYRGFAREVLDAFGPIGGYNFLWAWATGRSAGTAAASTDKGGRVIRVSGVTVDLKSGGGNRSLPKIPLISLGVAETPLENCKCRPDGFGVFSGQCRLKFRYGAV